MKRTAAGFALAALALGGCNGASGSSLPMGGTAPIGTAVPGVQKHVSRDSRERTKIRVVIPKRKHRIRFHGHYISPATQSMAITVTPPAGSGGSPIVENVDLTPATNPNCVESLITPLTCTITIDLVPGNDVASFATYDGLLDGNGNPTGNELSADQNVPVTVAPGRQNQISVVLQGIPASVALAPLDGQLTESAPGQYSLPKCFNTTPTHVEVLGLDADGNVIIGSGAPTPSLSSSDSTLVTVATPAPTSPNVFALTQVAAPASGASLQLTASETPGDGSGGAGLVAPLNVTIGGGTQICGIVTLYTIPTANSNPFGIAAGPDGALWFTEYNGVRIGRIPTTATVADPQITEYAGIAGNPENIVSVGGALWFTEYGPGRIGMITTSGTILNSVQYFYGLNGEPNEPAGITAGPDGNVWFTVNGLPNYYSNGYIGVAYVGSAGIQLSYFLPPPNVGCPDGISAGPGQELYYIGYCGANIGELSITGVYSVTPFTPAANPQNIIRGPDGNMWFSEFSTEHNGYIGEAVTNGGVNQFGGFQGCPGEMTDGPDGALWFSNLCGLSLGRVTTSGALHFFPTLGAYASQGIATGSDGAIWFTLPGANQIGRMQ